MRGLAILALSSSTIDSPVRPRITSTTCDELPSCLPARRQMLFPSHHKVILGSSAATNPLFLRVLLNALHWSASKGFDLWRVFNDWSQAEVRARSTTTTHCLSVPESESCLLRQQH